MSECINTAGGEHCERCEQCEHCKPAVDNKTCPAVGCQKIGVCVPVTVTPFAHAKATRTKCCGKPRVVSGEMPCAGKKNGVCKFTISQTICIEVPVDFGATASVGDTFVDCLGASADDLYAECKDEEEVI